MPDDVAAFARAVAPCQRQVGDEAGLGLNPALVFRHGAVAAGIRAGLAG
jgi:hypothetical protein